MIFLSGNERAKNASPNRRFLPWVKREEMRETKRMEKKQEQVLLASAFLPPGPGSQPHARKPPEGRPSRLSKQKALRAQTIPEGFGSPENLGQDFSDSSDLQKESFPINQLAREICNKVKGEVKREFRGMSADERNGFQFWLLSRNLKRGHSLSTVPKLGPSLQIKDPPLFSHLRRSDRSLLFPRSQPVI